MRREIVSLLLLSVIASAALDQGYIQTVSRNGESTIERTMDVSLFANQLSQGGLERMAELCDAGGDYDCSVDVENKRITMAETFNSGGYYTLASEYGLPFITHTYTLTKVPTDKFSQSLDRLLVEANATDYASGGGAVRPIELSDKEGNAESAKLLKMLKANITYTITMPAAISEARAGGMQGEVSGATATFDLVSVMEDSEPIVVRSQEPNYGFIIAIAGVMVLAALALSFLGTRPGKKKKK